MSKKYPQETKSLKFAKAIHFIMPYIFLSLIGTIIWSLTYICLYFYKELLLCYIKKSIKFEGISYYEKIKEYKKHIKKILIFNLIVIFFWGVILFTKIEIRFYIIKSGFFIFIIGYIICWTTYYKKYSYINDYFDDFYVFRDYIKNEFLSNIKIFSKDSKKEKSE